MNNEILTATDVFLKKEIMKLVGYKDNTPRMAEYRIEHSYRVANIGLKIAREEGLDEERTFIACLLHDIGYSLEYETKEDYRNHGRYGAKIARPFLLELGYSPADVNEMCYGIAIHVDDISDFEGERTPLALTIGDADNIDRFDAYRIYETLHIKDYTNLSLDEQRQFVEKMLGRLSQFKELELGTKTATKMWNENIDFQTEFYNKLKKQIKNSENLVFLNE